MTEYTFNPPPGWPPAPPGWVPPQGWVPDPSWPPAPEGWQWWLPPAPAQPAPAPAPAAAPVKAPAPPEPTWRERHAEHKAAKELAERQQQWSQEQAELDGAVAAVQALVSGPGLSVGLVLKPGEKAVWAGEGQLVEPRRGPGHYAGGSQGLSFQVAKGVRYRVGASRGHYVPGDEAQTVVDRGTVTVTAERVVFTGTTATREWDFAKLLDTESTEDRTLVLIHVSDRQKVSGIKTAPAFADAVGLAVTIHQNGLPDTVAALSREADAHRAQRPS